MRTHTIIAGGIVLLIFACTPKPVGTLKGTVTPAEPGAEITVVQKGKPVASFTTAAVDGTFSAQVKAGGYTVITLTGISTLPVTHRRYDRSG
jgi:antitoxin (DNA-binding transcriptional repressor) of toxin-antitoxin stability system